MSEIQINFQDLNIAGKTVKLIGFNGQLDETNVDHEAKKIYQVIEEMPQPILLLNFEGLDYMNSKSIGYVTDWFTKATEKGGLIAIIGPKPNILDILKVVGITQIINVYGTMEAAKQALGETQSAAQPAVPQAVSAPQSPLS